MLSAKRIARPDLMPFATRYGVIGAVFAMISALFCVMVVIGGRRPRGG